jgi:hypothetical protein
MGHDQPLTAEPEESTPGSSVDHIDPVTMITSLQRDKNEVIEGRIKELKAKEKKIIEREKRLKIQERRTLPADRDSAGDDHLDGKEDERPERREPTNTGPEGC